MKYNIDSPFFRFLTRVADLIILNWVFLISCIPLVTIGAACTALYHVALKMVKHEESGILSAYIRSFRKNFRQSTICWIICLAIAALVVLDAEVLQAHVGSMLSSVLGACAGFLLILLISILQYLFPFLASFEATMFNAVKSACLMMVAFLPKTISMIIISVAAMMVTCMNDYTFAAGILFWLMIGFSLMALINSYFLSGIFEKAIIITDAPNGSGANAQ